MTDQEPLRAPSAAGEGGTPRTGGVDLSEPLLDAKAAGSLLGVPASTMYEWVRQGRLPCLRLGPRAIRWTREMLADWAAEQLDRGHF
ncbi:MAG: helix-turn-helix domain-containing protein [Actinobacteria bacterium]|nr:helix-turn-helix domain-containing protein [Actinomycetota bacterium]